MKSDLTFITNENEQTLLGRFQVLVKDTRFFDVLVGYFYASGFHALYPSLSATERIRILIGISTSKEVFRFIQSAKGETQQELQFSSAEVKEQLEEAIAFEMESSVDSSNVEVGVHKFIEWLRSGKLEIRAYAAENLHAKLYIMSFGAGDRDAGRVITGSSNFTEAGLRDNLEFNVELKNRADYDFALAKFEELWANAVDVSEKYVESVQTRTWLNDTITPYELYLKFLYEYFQDDLRRAEEITHDYTPEGFMDLLYQKHAVNDARKKLEEYGGVFISDVVGLGKTYIGALLASELNGRTLVIAPPVLLQQSNPGSWLNVFQEFGVRQGRFQSIGKLEELIKAGTDQYKNIIIDEAHRFRTESTVSYEKLATICRGKRVILVTATPYNNSPADILSQIKLFQNGKKSTIPNLANLEAFFGKLAARLKDLDRQHDHEEYMAIVHDNAKQIRDSVLKYLMVRRTRSEIVEHYGHDLALQKLKFPEVANPEPVLYELNELEDSVFTRTVELATRELSYARYAPLLYLKDEASHIERLAQFNMKRFMKIMLVKRLESSFHAFIQTVDRFIKSYERFLTEHAKGQVYVSARHSRKIFEFLEDDNFEAIQRLIEEEKAEVHGAEEFTADFISDLERDLASLREIRELWQGITRDPKLLAFEHKLKSSKLLKTAKLIIFTESSETAHYLASNLERLHPGEVLCFTGGSTAAARDKVIENFDARYKHPQEEFRILVTTEVLSEGVNLHRSNVVINYDIPWNPTRLMQRVGRVNRVDTKHDTVYSYTFFPTTQGNNEIKLKEAAEGKIHAFMTLLGEDASILTEGEPIESHELWTGLTSRETITGEGESGESELRYLMLIKTIREEQPDLFSRIKRLPRKARTGRSAELASNRLLTYFRKGKLHKFFLAQSPDAAEEYDSMTAARTLETPVDLPRCQPGADYYALLEANKQAFVAATTDETADHVPSKGQTGSVKLLRAVRDLRALTEPQEQFLKLVMQRLEEGALPKQTVKRTFSALQKLLESTQFNALKVVALLQTQIPANLLTEHAAQTAAQTAGPHEVILSEYLEGN